MVFQPQTVSGLPWVSPEMSQLHSSVAPRQSQGLSGKCSAKTASEDPAHPFSLGIKHSWDPHLTNEEKHLRTGGRILASAIWESVSLGPRGMRNL